jgi:hypothetical protein
MKAERLPISPMCPQGLKGRPAEAGHTCVPASPRDRGVLGGKTSGTHTHPKVGSTCQRANPGGRISSRRVSSWQASSARCERAFPLANFSRFSCGWLHLCDRAKSQRQWARRASARGKRGYTREAIDCSRRTQRASSVEGGGNTRARCRGTTRYLLYGCDIVGPPLTDTWERHSEGRAFDSPRSGQVFRLYR